MGKASLGQKRICQACGAPFYDLRKNPIICPKCGAKFDPEALLKARKRPAKEVEKPLPDAEDIVAEEELLDDEAPDDDIIAEDPELDEDDDLTVIVDDDR